MFLLARGSDPCSGRGTLFFGECMCQPGWDGALCEVPWSQPVKPCVPKVTDICFFHPAYGVAQVTKERWSSSSSVEMVTWATRKTDVDRNDAHRLSFDNYKALPANLGRLLEIGSGPFTLTKTILAATSATVESVTLVDPLIFRYIDEVEHCSFKSGRLGNHKTTLVAAGAEDVDFQNEFDTVVMINVIEHCSDAFRVLQNAFNAVKDGGVMVWHERLWNAYDGTTRDPRGDREFHLHPIRIRSKVAELFMAAFEPLYRIDNEQSAELRRLKNEGVYFIGRKRKASERPADSKPEVPSAWFQSKSSSSPSSSGSTLPEAPKMLFASSQVDMSRLSPLAPERVAAIRKQLTEFSSALALKATDMYGHILSGEGFEQAESYMLVASQPWIRTICEIGFAAGHSTALYLASNPDAVVYSFDDMGRAPIVKRGRTIVDRMFPGRLKEIVEGDSTKTVPAFAVRMGRSFACDLISIDGAHHAQFPFHDMNNMVTLAARRHIVMLDDFGADWPAVMFGYQRVHHKDGALHLIDSVKHGTVRFRGHWKSWAFAAYQSATVVIAHHDNERRGENVKKIIARYLELPFVREVVVTWDGPKDAIELRIPTSARVRVVNVPRNDGLNHRWMIPVHTDWVFMNDDDLLPSSRLLQVMWNTLLFHPAALVGVTGRRIGEGVYEATEKPVDFPKANALLPRVLALHNDHRINYADPAHERIHEYVRSQEAHCDDMALNILSSRVSTRKILLTGVPSADLQELSDSLGGLGGQRDRMKLRQDCVTWLQRVAGNPHNHEVIPVPFPGA